jgi:hypothetical protein
MDMPAFRPDHKHTLENHISMSNFVSNLLSAAGLKASANGERRTHTHRIFAAGCCALALLPLSLLYGQGPAGTVTAMRVNIPFQFTVADQVLPAGKYMVYANAGERELVVRDGEHFARLRFAAASVFRKENDVLHKVWAVGESKGAVLPVTKHEKELAKLAPRIETASIASE